MTPRVRVLYDGNCAFCRRSARVLRQLDILNGLEWVDFRRTNVDVDLERLEHEMAAIARARVYFGFSAYRAISWRLPIFWPLLPFLYVPGVRVLGDAIYKRIARRRHRICRIDLRRSTAPKAK